MARGKKAGMRKREKEEGMKARRRKGEAATGPSQSQRPVVMKVAS